jgi:hypothetical protein
VDDVTKERIRTLTVEMLIAFRSEYLQTPGKNVQEHWRILLDRMRQAARQTGNVDEWATKVQRRLQIPMLGNLASSALLALSHAVREADAWRDFRLLIERETGLLEALGRQVAEAEKERKEQERAEKAAKKEKAA